MQNMSTAHPRFLKTKNLAHISVFLFTNFALQSVLKALIFIVLTCTFNCYFYLMTKLMMRTW